MGAALSLPSQDASSEQLFGEQLQRLGLAGADLERGHLTAIAGFLPCLQPVANLVRRADEVDGIHELVRDRGDRFGLLAVEEEILDLLGGLHKAHALRVVVVEVLVPGAHATHVLRDVRLDRHHRFLDVVAHDTGDADLNVEVLETF